MTFQKKLPIWANQSDDTGRSSRTKLWPLHFADTEWAPLWGFAFQEKGIGFLRREAVSAHVVKKDVFIFLRAKKAFWMGHLHKTANPIAGFTVTIKPNLGRMKHPMAVFVVSPILRNPCFASRWKSFQEFPQGEEPLLVVASFCRTTLNQCSLFGRPHKCNLRSPKPLAVASQVLFGMVQRKFLANIAPA